MLCGNTLEAGAGVGVGGVFVEDEVHRVLGFCDSEVIL